jgi:asparagine synthase (glutamine-hydrolysing)
MCGIAGVWSTGVLAAGTIVKEMTAVLHHRGPDSNDIWTSPNGCVGLGHARLAIVDLSEYGRQPMQSRSGRYVIVFNGEIYNHLELRTNLGTTVSWRGHSDTETLLEAIDKLGLVKALEASVGMFALALWDRETNSLSLARDRMGEKPLYYGRSKQGVVFASELKALRSCPGLDLSLDFEALHNFVKVGYVASPRSAFRGIKKLPQGAVLTVSTPYDDGSIETYWTLPTPTTRTLKTSSPHEDDIWLSNLEQLLDRSVRQQMLSDVPLGAFLSGGIDSSLIVALMQRASSQRIRTFSMGVSDQIDDESQHARKVAEYLGTDHTEMMVSPEDVLAVVPKLAGIYDEPFADSSQVPTVLLSQLTRRHVTVALSGDAGDELFGGYNRYITAARLEPVMEKIPLAMRQLVAGLLRVIPPRFWDGLSASEIARRVMHVPPSMGEKMERLAGFLAAPTGHQAYLRTVSQWLSESSIPLRSSGAKQQLPDFPSAALPQQMMWWDMQSYLPDDILVKVDRAAMAYSLETRVPFLDYRIVEFALSTPMQYKIRGGQSKWLLRQLLARHVPRNLFERPKQGFTLPLAQWLRGPLRDWAEDLLEPQALNETGLFNSAMVRKAWQEHLTKRFNHQRGLWTVLMFQSWNKSQ